MRQPIISVCVFVLPALLSVAAGAASDPPSSALRLSRTIPLPELVGRLDQIVVDEQRGRAFVTAVADKSLVVIDLKSGAVVNRIRELKQPQGVAFLARHNLVAMADSSMGFVRFYDADSLTLVRESAQHEMAHYLAGDPGGDVLFLGHGRGSLSALDVQTARTTASAKLPEHPEEIAVEQSGSRLFVNIGTVGLIAVIDRTTMELIDTWSLPGAQWNFGLALDEKHSRLFVAAQQPTRMFVLDTKDGSVIAKHPIMGDCNSIHYDRASRRIYATCGVGTIDVFEQTSADEYRLIDRMATAAGARTSCFSPALGLLLLPVPATRQAQVAELRVYEVAAHEEHSNAKEQPATAVLPASSSSSAAQVITFDFDAEAIGSLPKTWKVAATNPAEPMATWTIAHDAKAPSGTNALALTAARHGQAGTFNICWTDQMKFTDGEIEVSFKAISGTVDQGGGPMWRVQDSNNYYIARANPLEKNFRIYHVKESTRTMIASADVNVPANIWHKIKIQHHGDHIIGWLNDQKLLDVKDATISKPGGIGVWTKADALTSFDHLVVRPMPQPDQQEEKND